MYFDKGVCRRFGENLPASSLLHRCNRKLRVRALLAVLLVSLATDAASAARSSSEENNVPLLERVLADGGAHHRSDFRPHVVRPPREFVNLAESDVHWATPTGSSPKVLDNGEIEFPDGSLISKLFYIPLSVLGNDTPCEGIGGLVRPPRWSSGDVAALKCAVELRILEKTSGGWLPHVFARESDRWVSAPSGRVLSIRPAVTRSSDQPALRYTIPSVGDCVACHLGGRARQEFGPIGFSPSRRPADWMSERSKKQDKPFGATPQQLSNTQNNARAYLDTNCGYCHNPNGLAASSGLLLDAKETNPLRLGICKRPVAFGSSTDLGVYDIEPGQPGRSILIHRMKSLEPGVAMPEFGRELVDVDGIALIARWIAEMDGNCSNNEAPQ